MQRWVNNTATSLGVQIWGSREKYLKLAEQLQAARIWWQDWIEADPSLFYGQGASVFGGSELTLFGDFLTEHRKFDKRTSKNR